MLTIFADIAEKTTKLRMIKNRIKRKKLLRIGKVTVRFEKNLKNPC